MVRIVETDYGYECIRVTRNAPRVRGVTLDSEVRQGKDRRAIRRAEASRDRAEHDDWAEE